MSSKTLKILPLEWKTLTSQRYPEKIYFFNSNTGASSWEFPDSSKEDSLNKKESVPKSNWPANKTQKTELLETELLEEQSSKRCVNATPTAVVAPVIFKNSCNNSKKSSNIISLKRKIEVPFKQSLNRTTNSAQQSQIKKIQMVSTQIVNNSQNSKKSSNIISLKRKIEVPSKQSLNRTANSAQQSLRKKIQMVSTKVQMVSTEIVNNSQKNNKVQNKWKSCSVPRSFTQSSVSSSNADTKETKLSSSNQFENLAFRNKRKKIAMLNTSAELTTIDELPSFKDGSVDSFASYYFVVDTNVLLTKLKLLDEIKDTPLEGCGPPHIFIPWIVIQELDRLKNRSKEKTRTRRAAADAIQYLNMVLTAKHPRFHGQSPLEVKDWPMIYNSYSDDKVLQCCISLIRKMPQEKVILLTCDKNLSNKAMICNIRVHTWNSMMETLKTDVIFKVIKSSKSSRRKRKRKGLTVAENGAKIGGVPGGKNIKRRDNCKQLAENGAKMRGVPGAKNIKKRDNCKQLAENGAKIRGVPGAKNIKKRDNCKQEIKKLLSSAWKCLKEVLDPFLEAEMCQTYGDQWKSFPIERKLLKGMLDAIIKYWSSVFQLRFSEKDKRKFESLSEKINQTESFCIDKNDCLMILSDIEDVFIQIRRHWNHIRPCTEKLQRIKISCLEAFSRFDKIECSIQETELKQVLALFEHNWAVLNQLCGVVLDYYEVPHDFEYKKPEVYPEESVIIRLMYNLYPCVGELKELMLKMFDNVIKCLPCGAVYENLFKALKDFVPSLEVEAASPPSNITVKALENFCRAVQNRDMIQIGVKQITNFHTKLDRATAVMMSTKGKKCLKKN